MTEWMGVAAIALVGLGIAWTVFLVVRNPPRLAISRLGLRGLKRELALQGSFRLLEPTVRVLSGGIAQLPIHRARRASARQLKLAGDWLGLSADEFIALSVLSALGGAAFGLAAMIVILPSPWLVIGGGALGGLLPWSRVSEEQKRREKLINRALPGTIELAALCMGAGLDFPGSLRQILETASDRSQPLYEELQQILQELGLGRTREKALQGFADRVPAQSVRDFVSAVVQAERKGTPLADVLRIQAGLQRQARSVRIEEGAAKASVGMVVPLVLLLGATLLLIMGPAIMKTSGGF